MPSIAEQTVAARLAELRPALVARVAERLAAALPMVGVAPGAAAPAASHHAQMHATAQRFHDLVQLTVAADPSLASFEYDWTSRVLGPKGVTWEHQLQLIEAYFALARQLGAWSAEEQAELDRLAGRLRSLGEQVYRP
jgi:hypothetical protein